MKYQCNEDHSTKAGDDTEYWRQLTQEANERNSRVDRPVSQDAEETAIELISTLPKHLRLDLFFVGFDKRIATALQSHAAHPKVSEDDLKAATKLAHKCMDYLGSVNWGIHTHSEVLGELVDLIVSDRGSVRLAGEQAAAAAVPAERKSLDMESMIAYEAGQQSEMQRIRQAVEKVERHDEDWSATEACYSVGPLADGDYLLRDDVLAAIEGGRE